MSQLQDKFNAIIAKIEERITNQEDLNFLKEQIAAISMLYIDELNKVMDLSERRVNQVFENQKILEQKMAEIEHGMSHIEKELYIEDEDYDFEIVCPYCNYEFVSDNIGSDVKEVECPECHNLIELDWNQEEEGCSGHCSGCHSCEEEIKEEPQNKEDEDM